jgi:predicted nuclease of restriction endonuclease-like (RecB) superfamily
MIKDNEYMDNITKFLFELGKGFSLVGREYRLSAFLVKVKRK